MAPCLAFDVRCVAMLALLQKLARIGIPLRVASSELDTQICILRPSAGRAAPQRGVMAQGAVAVGCLMAA